MKKTIFWILAVAAVLLLALSAVWTISNLWRYGGMMGGYGMMGHGFGFMPPLGWAGMLFMWLIPAAIFTLLVVGVVALVNTLIRSNNAAQPAVSQASGRACQNCSRPAQADWNTCPYCGQTLS
ncbi:MAG: zinc ribbon domain-containing protein [Chloroflexota bacterium]